MEDEPLPERYYLILKKICIFLYNGFLLMIGNQVQKRAIQYYSKVVKKQQYEFLDTYEIYNIVNIEKKKSKYFNKHILDGFIDFSIFFKKILLIECIIYCCNKIRMKLCPILQNANAPPLGMKL